MDNYIAAIAIAIAEVWLLCGAFAYALTFAHFQREFPTLAERDYYKDRRSAVFSGCLGPIGLLVSISNCGLKHGLKWR